MWTHDARDGDRASGRRGVFAAAVALTATSIAALVLATPAAPQDRAIAGVLPRDAVLQPGAVDHLLYDLRLAKLVVLAGSRDLGVHRLWSWSNGRWNAIDAAGPSARELGAATYDARRQRIVLHGGMGMSGSGEMKSDTWEWDGKSWHQATDASIGPRDHHALAYDEARSRSVLFGGRNSPNTLGHDTWEWDGTRWTRAAADGPGGRAHFPLAYDTARKHVVLFGGVDERYKVHNDTWTWDGRQWQKIDEGGPPVRSHHRMAFDAHRGTLVLFGGLRGGRPAEPLGDTWLWDGRNWREMKGAGPPARSGHVMTYDPSRRAVVLFGGGSFDGRTSRRFDDLWEWSGQAWVLIR